DPPGRRSPRLPPAASRAPAWAFLAARRTLAQSALNGARHPVTPRRSGAFRHPDEPRHGRADPVRVACAGAALQTLVAGPPPAAAAAAETQGRAPVDRSY